ncbi:MAG: hypothetical protein IPH35_26530 [Rhodoferax sp.]|nr:hypothetical protein [Rhodoferax sp.]
MEEAPVLRELIDSLGLSQREAARQCARDVSWAHRRLVLLGALVPGPGAVRGVYRVGRAHALWPCWRAPTASMPVNHWPAWQATTGMRELQAWFSHHHKAAQHTQRQRMVNTHACLSTA